MPAIHGGQPELVEALTEHLLSLTEALERNSRRMDRLDNRSMFVVAILEDQATAQGRAKAGLELARRLRGVITETNRPVRLHIVDKEEVG